MLLTATAACSSGSRSRTGYDPDTSDDQPEISYTLSTFGERPVVGSDSVVGVVLHFSCGEGGMRAFVSASDFLEEDKGARVRLDSQPSFSPGIDVINTSNEGFVVFREPGDFLKRLVPAERLLVEFTTRGRSLPDVAKFNVRGAGRHVSAVLAPCKR